MPPWTRWCATLAAAVASVLPIGFATAAGADPTPEPPAPNIILVTIDTLRADHVGCYGAARPTTPFLDGLARRGVRFTSARATSSWTVPSMASVMSGLYPRSHGVRHGHVARMRQGIDEQEALAPHIETLAEALAAAGYTTYGVSSNAHMAVGSGHEQGFDHYVGKWFVTAPEVNRVVLGWQALIAESRPYFLWVHYFDPHDPYLARRPWIAEYLPGRDRKDVKRWGGMTMKRLVSLLPEIREDPNGLSDLEALYDSEIRFTDDHLSSLLGALEPGSNTVVVVTSDHGEGFLDHGEIGHGNTLFDELIRVPLIVVLPHEERAGTVVDATVSLVDLLPTLVEIGHAKVPAAAQGRSLSGLMAGGGEPDRPVFAELDRPRHGGVAEVVVVGRYKLEARGPAGEQRRLFDLSEDPGETRDLTADRPEIARRLASNLSEWTAAHPLCNPPQATLLRSAEQLEQLKSLGYVE